MRLAVAAIGGGLGGYIYRQMVITTLQRGHYTEDEYLTLAWSLLVGSLIFIALFALTRLITTNDE